MARIAIVVDGELAHVLPTFSIAKELTKRGHQICYIGLAPAREPVSKRGFSFIPVGQSVIGSESTTADTGLALSLLFQSILRGDFLDPVVEAMAPQLIITLSVFCLIALTLTYRYQIPVVLLRTQCTLLSRREELRNSIASGLLQVSGKVAELCHLLQKSGISVSSVADLTHLALAIPEIVLLPPGFEPESDYRTGQSVYAGAALEAETITETFPWKAVDLSRKIIYCSLGTRPDLRRTLSLRFFRLVIEAIAEQPEFQLILSTGRRISPHELSPPAPNVHIADWVPQGEVLKRATLMITHGGLGSIKECICAGVPMIVFPVMRDQFCGAERVVRLGLGMRGQIANVSTGELLRLIQTVTGCSAFKSRVMTMREHFLRSDLGAAIALIENAAKPA